MSFEIVLENVGNSYQIVADKLENETAEFFVLPEHRFVHDNDSDQKLYQCYHTTRNAIYVNTRKVTILKTVKDRDCIYMLAQMGTIQINIIGAYFKRSIEGWKHLTEFTRRNLDTNHHLFVVGDLNTHLECIRGQAVEYSNGTYGLHQRLFMDKFHLLQYNQHRNEFKNLIDVCLGSIAFDNVKSNTRTTLRFATERAHSAYSLILP